MIWKNRWLILLINMETGVSLKLKGLIYWSSDRSGKMERVISNWLDKLKWYEKTDDWFYWWIQVHWYRLNWKSWFIDWVIDQVKWNGWFQTDRIKQNDMKKQMIDFMINMETGVSRKLKELIYWSSDRSGKMERVISNWSDKSKWYEKQMIDFIDEYRYIGIA
jgi:hypothetical protein